MITGEKIVLRAIEPSDIRQLWEWQQDEELMRLRDYPIPPRTYAEVEKEYIVSASKTDELNLAITTREGVMIGEIAFKNLENRVGDVELTIFIGDKTYWGHGYGSDAVRTLSKYGFEQLNLHRVTLYVHDSNVRAIRAYIKCGFVEEGRLRESEYMDGNYSDIVIMGLLKRDFENMVERRAEESRRNIVAVRI